VSDVAERAMRTTLLTLSHRRSIGRLATRVPVTRPMVRRFVAGETLDEVLPAIERLHAQGMGTTVDVLGESVTAEADARAAATRYTGVLDALGGNGFDRNVSLKPSQMGLAIDPGLARENIGMIVARAVETGAFVRIDMEDHTTTDATLDLWRSVRPSGGDADVGVVLQAALRRSDEDLEAIIEAGGRVRLCKGAYKEPAAAAYQDKAEVDEAYERLMLRLLRAGRYPAIATHDVRLIKRAIEVATAEGIPRDAFEFQMLYGVRRDLQEELVQAGWRVRVYVPFGGQWYPYFMRRLAERPANVSFLLRNMWRERGRS
jgi:proline dehydrogenase